MRQPIGFNQETVEQLAAQADEMSDWLREQPATESTRILPGHLTIIWTTTLAYGPLLIYKAADLIGPNGASCWGTCHSGT